jgi:hypothetical protein
MKSLAMLVCGTSILLGAETLVVCKQTFTNHKAHHSAATIRKWKEWGASHPNWKPKTRTETLAAFEACLVPLEAASTGLADTLPVEPELILPALPWDGDQATTIPIGSSIGSLPMETTTIAGNGPSLQYPGFTGGFAIPPSGLPVVPGSPVPEPASFALLATGLVVLLRRKLMVLLLVLCADPTIAQEPHRFFDRENVLLFSADAATRVLDAQSTRAFMTDPCRCYKEDNLPLAIAGSGPRMYGYSIGVSAAIVGGAWLLHRRGFHRTERLLPAADALYDGPYVIKNWRLMR